MAQEKTSMNKRTAIATGICLTAGMALAQSNTDGSVFSDSGIINKGSNSSFESNVIMEGVDSHSSSFSIKFGYHNWKDTEDVDTSYGAQAELRIAIAESPLDFLLRTHYANVEYDDYVIRYSDDYRYYSARVHESSATLISEREQQCYGGSLQLLFNFQRGESINPYVAAGAMYEKSKYEYDWGTLTYNRMSLLGLSASWYDINKGHSSDSDDGTAFVGRLGLDMDFSPIYGRIEAAYLTKMYREGKSQCELNAILGVKVTDSLRVDLSGTYFTDWKEYYITAGLTYLFL